MRPQVETSIPKYLMKNLFYAQHFKYFIKLPSGQVYIKHTFFVQVWVSSPRSHYMYANIPKIRKQSEIQNTSGPKNSDKGCSTCTQVVPASRPVHLSSLCLEYFLSELPHGWLSSQRAHLGGHLLRKAFPGHHTNVLPPPSLLSSFSKNILFSHLFICLMLVSPIIRFTKTIVPHPLCSALTPNAQNNAWCAQVLNSNKRSNRNNHL